MLRWLARLDHLTAASRPAWGWLGELALIVLGIHLAADRLDDRILDLMVPLQLPWPSPEFPLQLATWTAIAVELFVVGWAAWMLVRSRAEPVDGVKEWGRRATLTSLLAPLAWAPLALVGAWVVAMALEDVTAPLLGEPALWLSWVVAGLIAWRLGWSGLVRVLTRPPEPRRRLEGWFAAPAVLLVVGLALRYGLPLHAFSGVGAQLLTLAGG